MVNFLRWHYLTLCQYWCKPVPVLAQTCSSIDANLFQYWRKPVSVLAQTCVSIGANLCQYWRKPVSVPTLMAIIRKQR